MPINFNLNNYVFSVSDISISINKFILKSAKNKLYFLNKSKSKKLFNLRKYVTDKLKQCKVEVDQVNHDTFAEKNNFFSYRRSCKLKQKDYGRCISTIRMLN